jgi:hypothetical protein
MAALDRGWIPKGDLNGPEVAEACAREDSGAYRCVVKKGMPDESIVNAVAYILNVENRSDTAEAQDILHKSGPDLYDAANTLIDSFFQEHRLAGVTCDFGGLAMYVLARPYPRVPLSHPYLAAERVLFLFAGCSRRTQRSPMMTRPASATTSILQQRSSIADHPYGSSSLEPSSQRSLGLR